MSSDSVQIPCMSAVHFDQLMRTRDRLDDIAGLFASRRFHGVSDTDPA